jgi:3-hydroxyacyl-CoA dehydrogenase/enoyl-CoA hydratase/3-hydroxybutyryl-CoA epimerase
MKGMQVRLKERDAEAGAKALGAVWDLVKQKRDRKQLTRAEAQRALTRVTASPDLTGFAACDLVIEAVFEDLALKQRLLKELEAITPETCIFASNTSSIPIGRIAEASARPQQVLGMHFFSPVHKMPLLEVIVTPRTADRATATAVAYGKRVGKQVIVVHDGPGFYTSRILAPYMTEATRVLVEGASVDEIDRALMDFGFPVGPITLLDEVGIDVGAKVTKIMHEAFGERMAPVAALQAVIDDKRQGRKNNRGFYRYEKGKKAGVDETVYDLLPGGRKRKAVADEEVQQRVVLAMVNEALLCMGEGILRSPRDGDIGAIFGLGFPPFLGGPFRYVDMRGAERVLDEMKKLHDRYGERFAPAPALVEAARNRHMFRD